MTQKTLRLRPDRYVTPTPAGCYFAVKSPDKHDYRDILLQLLREPSAPKMTEDLALRLTQRDSPGTALKIIHEMERMHLITAASQSKQRSTDTLAVVLDNTLPKLSSSQKVILSDNDRGLYLQQCGFSTHEAESLSALGAKLNASLDASRDTLAIDDYLQGQTIAMVDPFGCSHVGWWPLYIGETRLCLIVEGMPEFASHAFASLIWALIQRYGLAHHVT